MKNAYLFLIVGLLIAGSVFLFNPIKEEEVNCYTVDSPQVNTYQKSIHEVIEEFENSPKFKGYELKDYRECN